MRSALIKEFRHIYVLNLHGDSRKQATPPPGKSNENVFDIQQGVTITILVKSGEFSSAPQVKYSELWGTREEKYRELSRHDVNSTIWQPLAPTTPNYLLVPVSTTSDSEFASYFHLYDVFGTGNHAKDNHECYGAGFVTQQDKFAIAHDGKTLRENVQELLSDAAEEKALRRKFDLCSTNQWSYARARKELAKLDFGRLISRCLYRPFDYRFTLLDRNVCTILRKRITHQFDKPNVALLTTRRITRLPFNNIFVSNLCTEYKVASHDRNTIVFPLYLYPVSKAKPKETNASFSFVSEDRQPNLSPQFTNALEGRLNLKFIKGQHGDFTSTVGPQDIFNYVYAILHSPTYRHRYGEFLKLGFPRIPLTGDRELFRRLCELGGELVSLHLLESPEVAKPTTRFDIEGSCEVAKGFPKYLAPGSPEPGTGKPLTKGRVYINSSSPAKLDGQDFDNVPPEVWEFNIGGYQVCEKWLKDRRGRTLTHDDIEHYQKVVTALAETIRLMQEIDAAIPKWPIE